MLTISTEVVIVGEVVDDEEDDEDDDVGNISLLYYWKGQRK